MNRKIDKETHKNISRRKFLTAAALGGAAAGALGFPNVARVRAAKPVKLKIQSVWEGGTLGYVKFKEFCRSVGKMSKGKLMVEGYPAGTIVETYEMFDAVKARVFDGMFCFDAYWSEKIPVATFLSSYPFGLDRPDQWETWYNALGGREIAREAFSRHNMHYIGPIQQGENLIHSKVPIRSFEDFKGKKIKCPGGITADFYRAIGAIVTTLPGRDVHPNIDEDDIDALFYGSAAINLSSGYSDVAKYVIMDVPSFSSLLGPVNIMSIAINKRTWTMIPKLLQLLFEALVAKYSYDQYSAFQKADMEAYEKLQKSEDPESTEGTEGTEEKQSEDQAGVEKPADETTGESEMEYDVEIIRLKESDIGKFKQYAPAIWVRWAKKSPLAMKAFESQLALLKSVDTGYITEKDMVDLDGKKLVY